MNNESLKNVQENKSFVKKISEFFDDKDRVTFLKGICVGIYLSFIFMKKERIVYKHLNTHI